MSASTAVTPEAPSEKRLVGINGWLLLLIIKLWASAVVRALVGLGQASSLDGIINLCSAALSGIAAYLLGIKNPRGVLLAKIFLAVDVLYYLLQLMPPTDNPARTLGFLIASLLYFVYLFRSKRVKNTYAEQPPPKRVDS
jgi:hypothetical protein